METRDKRLKRLPAPRLSRRRQRTVSEPVIPPIPTDDFIPVLTRVTLPAVLARNLDGRLIRLRTAVAEIDMVQIARQTRR